MIFTANFSCASYFSFCLCAFRCLSVSIHLGSFLLWPCTHKHINFLYGIDRCSFALGRVLLPYDRFMCAMCHRSMGLDFFVVFWRSQLAVCVCWHNFFFTFSFIPSTYSYDSFHLIAIVFIMLRHRLLASFSLPLSLSIESIFSEHEITNREMETEVLWIYELSNFHLIFFLFVLPFFFPRLLHGTRNLLLVFFYIWWLGSICLLLLWRFIVSHP